MQSVEPRGQSTILAQHLFNATNSASKQSCKKKIAHIGVMSLREVHQVGILPVEAEGSFHR